MTSVNTTACCIYSSCAYFSRGHQRIAFNIRSAAERAGVKTVLPIPISNVPLLRERVSALLTTHSRVLVVRDFPDTPVNDDFGPTMADFRSSYAGRVSSMYIAMKATAAYMDLYRDYNWTPCAYDVVVSVEPGACRTALPVRGESARCAEADVKIAPLVQAIPPLSSADTAAVQKLLKERKVERPVLWLRSGTAEEESSVARWLRDSLGDRYISSLEIEEVLRQHELSVVGSIRCAALFQRIIASPGYSTFWELYALDLTSRVVKWIQLDRPIEDVGGRLRLLEKPKLLETSTAASLKRQTDAGIEALALVINRHLTSE